MRIPFLGAVVLLGCAVPLRGAEPTVVELWPENPPGFQVTSGPEKDTSTAESRKVAGRSVVRLGNVSKPQLHVYPAPIETRNGTAVVVCPGGGFHILAWDLEGTEVAEWLNSLGVTAAVLKYRVPTKKADKDWIPPTQDAQRAIRWLRSNPEQWSIDPERIGILGFSAGGRTAAMTAISGETSLYEDVDEVDDASPAPDFQILVYPAYLVEEETGRLRAEVGVDRSSPPAFLVHTQNDRVTCRNSIALFLALTEAKVPAELHVYETGGHGYGLRATDNPVTHWPARCEGWLRGRELLTGAD